MLEDPTTLLIAAASLVCVVVGTLVVLRFKNKNPTALPLDDFAKFKLVRKEQLSHDTYRFTFALPSPDHVLGLPTGQHISFRFKDADGKVVQRSYTPVTDNSVLGEVSFVIKVYKAGVHPKFPDGGMMSQHVDRLKIGEELEMKGPKGHMEYLNGGKFTVKPLGKPLEHREANNIVMLAGGTGITPMLQVLNFIFTNPGVPGIKVNLLYANQTEADILVRDELEALAKEHSEQFKLHYTLDRPPEEWKYSSGFITKDMLKEHCLFNDSPKDTQVFMCGPPPMVKFACQANLKELGFTEKDWVAF